MRYTIEKEKEVKRLAELGKSSQYITSLTGIPERVVWSWCPETRPHDDVIKWSVKQRYHSILPEFEAKITAAISPLVRTDISEETWEEVNKVVFNTLFEEAIVVFKNLLEEPPEFGSEKKLSKEPFLDYLKRFWTMDSEYVKARQLNESYVMQNKNSIHYWSLLRKFKLYEINTGDIERMYEHICEKGLSQHRVNAIMKTGLIPLKVAYSEGLIMSRCFNFYLPRPERHPADISAVNISRIFNSEWQNDEAFVANLIACNCKLQLQEVRALRLCNLTTDSVIISSSYSNEKGLVPNRNPRVVMVSEFVINILLKYASTTPYKDLTPDDFIFYSENRDHPAHGKKWSSELKRICESCSIEGNISFRSWTN